MNDFMITEYSVPLISRTSVAEDTFQYNFAKPEGFAFIAGQYMIVDIPDPSVTDDRPAFRSLTIASAPHEDVVSFIMRHSESGFKQSLYALEMGDHVTLKGPLGQMHLPEDSGTPIVFLVAGVGITPARSMLRDAAHRSSDRTFRLIYSNRELCSAACFAEMCDVDLAHYEAINVMSRSCENWDGPIQLVDAAFIKANTDDLDLPLFYVVGTKGYINAMKAALIELEIPEDRMIFDNFG